MDKSQIRIGDVIIRKHPEDKDLPEDEARYLVGCVVDFDQDGNPICAKEHKKPN